MPSPFPVDPQLTAIAIAVSVNNLIADEVLPRTSPLAKSMFSYQYFPSEQFFTVPDSKVGRKSKVNEVSFHGELRTEETEDFGLDHPLSFNDLRDAPDNTDIRGLTTEWLMQLVLLGREVRCARKVFTPDVYEGNTETLTAADRFDNPVSDPLELIEDILDRPIIRPNIMVIGQSEWRRLRMHPRVVKAVHSNSGDSGIAARAAVAELFELDRIVVGRSRVNLARPGATPLLTQCWSGGMSLLYQDTAAAKIAGLVDGASATFGFTAQTGQRVAGSKPDGDIGLRGGEKVRAGETIKEVICAPALGYYVKDVITPV